MRDATEVRPSHPGREWYCYRCPTLLASFDAKGLHLHPVLTRHDGDVDGLPYYAQQRAHISRFVAPKTERQVPEPTRKPPLAVRCPSCRALQRLAG